MHSARGWLAFGLGSAALLWSFVLLLAAFVFPAYSGEGCQAPPNGATACGALPSETLFAVNGWWVVELLVGVIAVTALAFWALHLYCARGAQRALGAAAFFIGLLAIFSFLTGFSIGLYVVPVVLLLIVSAAVTPEPAK